MGVGGSLAMIGGRFVFTRNRVVLESRDSKGHFNLYLFKDSNIVLDPMLRKRYICNNEF